jgi:hypothetical protein
MTPSAWISLAGVVGQLLIAVFFFGRTDQKVDNLVERAERTDKLIDKVDGRVDTLELRVNDHTERIARLEGREG